CQLAQLRRVSRFRARARRLRQRRPVRGPRRAAMGRDGKRQSTGHARRAEEDGSAPGRGAGCRGLGLLHGPRLRAQRVRLDGGADRLTSGERWRTSSGSYGWDEVMVATCSREELAGKSRAELARLTGREPAEAMMDLVLSEGAGVSMVVFSQSEENVAIASADP